MSWPAIGAKFGISGGMAYRIAMDGYEPKEPHIRHKLGLPALIPAPACLKCGEVHVSRRCTKNATPRKVCQSIRLSKVTADERTAILRLTPDERKRALLAAAVNKP